MCAHMQAQKIGGGKKETKTRKHGGKQEIVDEEGKKSKEKEKEKEKEKARIDKNNRVRAF